MATIPLLNGGEAPSVSATRAPASGTVNLGRFSSGVTSQLQGAAQGFRRQGASLQQAEMSASQGQGAANGLRGLARGVGDLSGVMLTLANKKAEAKNYADVATARNQMFQIEGEFDQWRLQNPDPEGWEPKWSELSSQARGKLTAEKGLSPAAVDQIGREFDDFNVRQTVNVGTMAVKGTVAKARAAVEANILRAVDARDLDAVKRETETAVSRGWMFEDDALRTMMQAEDAIEAKTIDILQNQKKTALVNGDIQGALTAVDAMPVRDDEKTLEKAIVTKQYGYQETLRKAEDILDPNDLLSALDTDEYAALRPSDKEKFRDLAYRKINDDDTVTVTALRDEIASGGVSSISDLQGRTDYEALPERDKAAVQGFIAKGAQNDIADFSSLKRSLLDYDPSEDPRGATRADLERSIAMRFDGPRAEELLTTLEEATSRSGPRSASERVVSDVFTDLQKRYEAGEVGGFRLTGADISERKDKNGNTVYTTPDPKGDFKDAGMFGTYTGRIIELSEQDRLRFKEKGRDAGEVFEDKRAKEAAFSRFLNVQGEIERKVKVGELTEADQITGEVNRLLGGELNGALESRLQLDQGGRALPTMSSGVSSGLFDPAATSDWIKNYKMP